MLTRIMEGYQSIDQIVSKIGDAIPIRLKMEFEFVPYEKKTLMAKRRILRSVFRRHKPPIFVGRHIGTGGFADVFAATSDYEGITDFAIKILRKELLEVRKGAQFSREDEEMRVKEVKQRFKNESYVQWDLSKSVSESVAGSVVKVFDHGEFDSSHEFRFILMERMDTTLRDYINMHPDGAKGSASLQCLLNIMIQIAESINNVHNEGVFHRDIKPENILFPKGKSPRACEHCSDPHTCPIDVKIGDFGTVRWIKSYTDKYDAVIIGSQFYMSPEQIINPRTIDKRTDIYSFGVVCYELLYGVHPKNVNQHTSNLLEKLAIEKPHPRTPPAGYEGLHDIICKCMENRQSRYQNMGEVIGQLKQFGEHQS
jgi:serine/threonine protein kinase